MRRDLYEPDHEAFREVVQAYVKREVTPNQERWEQEHVVDLQADIAIPYIVDLGTEEQQARCLPPMAAGECIGAIAMTEPGAGSDLQGIRTTAVRDGDGW